MNEYKLSLRRTFQGSAHYRAKCTSVRRNEDENRAKVGNIRKQPSYIISLSLRDTFLKQPND